MSHESNQVDRFIDLGLPHLESRNSALETLAERLDTRIMILEDKFKRHLAQLKEAENEKEAEMGDTLPSRKRLRAPGRSDKIKKWEK